MYLLGQVLQLQWYFQISRGGVSVSRALHCVVSNPARVPPPHQSYYFLLIAPTILTHAAFASPRLTAIRWQLSWTEQSFRSGFSCVSQNIITILFLIYSLWFKTLIYSHIDWSGTFFFFFLPTSDHHLINVNHFVLLSS